MLYAILKFVFKIWLTGMLFIVAVPGYCFYGVLWAIRLMQTKKVFSITLLSVFLVAAVAFFVSVYFLFPSGKLDNKVDIIIHRNTSIKTLADTLEQEQIVRSAKAMRFWLKVTGKDRKIQAGMVTFVKGEGVLKASDKLLHAVALEKVLKITEGLTYEQTAGEIQKQLGIDSLHVVSLCTTSTFIKQLGIESTSLEGYLFPETYRFPEDVKAEDVLIRMVRLFKNAYSKVVPDSLVVSKFTCHEIVTLASIVEKEATLAEERPRIAGVFHNRLKKGYPLGADPTVRYIFRKFSGPLRVSELNSASPYNTRKFAGLPPGPICSPGLGAIQAAAAPMQTDDLYFVAKWDGTGAHDFSKTNAEHDRKKILIRQENQRRLKIKGTQ